MRVRLCGGSAAAPPSTLFSTTFPNTENPLAGTGWIQGLSTGIDWQNMQSTPGKCFLTALSPTEYDDNIAHRNPALGISSTRHYVQGTLGITGGYSPPDAHEMALHLFSTITANSIFTYEILCALRSTSIVLMRWNGARGLFDQLATSSTFSALSDGDVVRGEGILTAGSPAMNIFVNAVNVLSFTDTSGSKLVTGQPGLGGFARAGGTLASHFWKAFSCDTI
jgi:hypothetical protein